MLYQADIKWYLSKEKAYKTPSFENGTIIEKESFYRQACAGIIQHIGQQLKMYF